MGRLTLLIVAGTWAAWLLAPAPALAYLTPDSGSMLLQLLLGGLAGLFVLLRILLSRIKTFLAQRMQRARLTR